MVMSLVSSGTSILSSSLTTIIGFIALVFMKYKIGLDMGLVLSIPSIYCQSHNQYYYGQSHLYKDSNSVVLMVPKGHRASENMLILDLKALPKTNYVTSYTSTFGLTLPDDFLPDEYKDLLISDQYSRIVINLSLDDESDETFSAIDQIKKIAAKYYGDEVHLVGNSVSTKDLKYAVSADNTKVNIIAAGSIFIILLLAFHSISFKYSFVLYRIFDCQFHTAWFNRGLCNFGNKSFQRI